MNNPTVNCPMCNVPRRIKNFSLNSGRVVCSSPQCAREQYSPDTTLLPEEITRNSQYEEVYLNNFKAIANGLVLLGSVQSIFNVRFSTTDMTQAGEEIIAAIKEIHENQVFEYKIAVSVGSILEKEPLPDEVEETSENQVMYYHSSSNNASLFYLDDNSAEKYRPVRSDTDIQEIITFIRERDWSVSKPDTKWKLVGNVHGSITILRVHGQQGGLIGRLTYIPGFLRRRGLLHFNRDTQGRRIHQDNLCFFRCLAHYLTGDVEQHVDIFRDTFPNDKKENFKGFSLSDLGEIEKKYKIKINVFSLIPKKGGKKSTAANKKNRKTKDECTLKCIRGKLFLEQVGERVMNLNLYKKHFSLVTDMDKYTQFHMCRKCRRLFSSDYNLRRHTNIKRECTQVSFVYKGGIYRNPPSVFDKLEAVGIDTPPSLKIYPYKIVYDFESYFSKHEENSHGKKENNKTVLNSHHVPLSASVASDFPGWESPVCFVKKHDGEGDSIVRDTLCYINELSVKISDRVLVNFKTVIEALDQTMRKEEELENRVPKNLRIALECEEGKKKTRGGGRRNGKPPTKNNTFNKRLCNLKRELLNYISRVPVLGFNSGRYDLNLIKREFHAFFSEREKNEIHTVKRCNQYIAVYTKNCLFLDMLNYLAPGYSYANYLKAFVKDEAKGFFPYEWMTSTRKLKNKKLPPRSAFYSSLTGRNISTDEYAACQRVWEREKMKTFRDYLVHYNNKDVAPFVKAINQHMKFFSERGIDMFKDGLTLPGLTLKFLFSNMQTGSLPYVLFSESERNIHDLVRANLVGGPSIIFHRHHKIGVTKIRERKYGPDSKVCRHIVGVDANSLYLKCMGEEHCTGYFVVRRRENNYLPEQSQKASREAAEWLRYRAIVDGKNILHHYNHGEVSVGEKKVRVDGIVPSEKLIYQFHGCVWHGHECHLNRQSLKTETGRRNMAERSRRTLETTLYLEAMGYSVVEQYECKWLKLRRNRTVLSTQNRWRIPIPDTREKMTENDIIGGVLGGTIFGLIEVDIHTPEHLKDRFSEMTPIFKNAMVSRSDVGDHMREHLKKHDRLKQPQRQLIGSYFGDKILLGTPLLKWYLEKGLKVTRVHLLVQYTPQKSFLPFVEQVTEARRLGDTDRNCKILSDLYKLLGNSSYGKTICNKKNFTNVRYISPKKAARLALHWTVQNVEDISENTCEVSCLPTTVTYDLPIQIGFMVYQYAKLKMLSFYYDFILKYIDLRDFEMCEMDTDSLYFALSSDNLDAAVKKDMLREYFSERHLWLPSDSCDDPHHRNQYVTAKTYDLPWLPLPCCLERRQWDKRTPGLFKVEWEGNEMISLNSKCYMGSGQESKTSCKGVVQKQNLLDLETFQGVLKSEEPHMVVNRGFKVVDHHVVTYNQRKRGLNYHYIKRKTCEDGVSTLPLDI